jgi:gluconolactonase
MLTTILPLESLETFAYGLDHPEGICEAPDGVLYVGGEAGQVYRIEPDASATELVSTGGFMLGLAADAHSRIYAIDQASKCVWCVDTESREAVRWIEGPPERRFATPNHGAFDAAGNYYISDSGEWGAADGCLWRVPAGSDHPKLWTEEVTNFPNGVALAEDDSRLFVLESLPGALVEVPIRADGSAGPRRVLCDMESIVPDGVALAEDGGFYIGCYRPDAVYRWHPDAGLSLLAADPRGTALAAPTNPVFCGPERDSLVVPNIGRWHLTRIPVTTRGISLKYPTRDQLGR